MVIKLYIDYSSQPSRSVLALCLAANIPHEVVEISILKKEQYGQEFSKVNPLHHVPAIIDTDNGLALAESHSILRYLCLKFELPEQWYPRADLAKQAKLNEFLDFHHSGTRKCTVLVFNLLFAPILKKQDPSFNREIVTKTVHTALSNFSKIYLKELNFLGGQQPNIGDLIAFHDITMLELISFDFSAYPEVEKWVARMKKEPYIIKANERFEENKVKFAAMIKQHQQPSEA